MSTRSAPNSSSVAQKTARGPETKGFVSTDGTNVSNPNNTNQTTRARGAPVSSSSSSSYPIFSTSAASFPPSYASASSSSSTSSSSTSRSVKSNSTSNFSSSSSSQEHLSQEIKDETVISSDEPNNETKHENKDESNNEFKHSSSEESKEEEEIKFHLKHVTKNTRDYLRSVKHSSPAVSVFLDYPAEPETDPSVILSLLDSVLEYLSRSRKQCVDTGLVGLTIIGAAFVLTGGISSLVLAGGGSIATVYEFCQKLRLEPVVEELQKFRVFLNLDVTKRIVNDIMEQKDDQSKEGQSKKDEATNTNEEDTK